METLDLTTFENAINSLNEVIYVWENKDSSSITRDSMIQRFEYTYSLALKMLKRFYKNTDLTEDEINGMTFNQMIRTANQMGLLKSDLETWDIYRQKRNMTSHTYDEETAQKVMTIIPAFKEEAEFLLNKLKEKLA